MAITVRLKVLCHEQIVRLDEVFSQLQTEIQQNVQRNHQILFSPIDFQKRVSFFLFMGQMQGTEKSNPPPHYQILTFVTFGADSNQVSRCEDTFCNNSLKSNIIFTSECKKKKALCFTNFTITH